MKTLKRVLAVGLVAAFASAGLATTAGADHVEPELTLAIDPDIGPVGQTINAVVPDDYIEQCGVDNPINLVLAELFTSIAAGETPDSPEETAALILAGAFGEGTDLSNTLETVLFPLVFADVETQEPVVDENTGEEAIDFWSPTTGTGDIVAPLTSPRPAIYAVAAACLGLLPPDEAAAAAVDALAEVITGIGTEFLALGVPGQAVPGLVEAFLGCVLQDIQAACDGVIAALDGLQLDGEAILAEMQAQFDADLEEIIGTFLEAVIDPDPVGVWAALYCLTGDNFETCEEPPAPAPAPAEPVAVTPRFTG